MNNLIPVGEIVKFTPKGQITIPKKIREAFAIDEKTVANISVKGAGIMVVPVKKVATEDVWTEERRKKLLKTLGSIQGIWAKDWPQIKRRLEKQRKRDLVEIKRLRKF